jgi:rod shape-determining protein MreB and related proteins
MEDTIFDVKAKPRLSDMMNFNFLRKKSFGIDLGNNNTLVSDGEKLLVAQPSCIVLDKVKDTVRAVGTDAYDMFEKTHRDLKHIKPLKGGVIADYSSATKMIAELFQKACGSKSFLDRYENIVTGVPYNTTNVERRALKATFDQFNASAVHLVFEPLAAAIGMDLDISQPEGKMVVDMGGGITEIAVVSLSGIACFQSLKVSGDSMDEEIQHHFRRTYNMAIGLRTAEQIKINVGSVLELSKTPRTMIVRGKDLLRGIPVTRETDSKEISTVLEKSITAIELSIVQTLEKCPPELAADIYDSGIYITGGNAMLAGIKERFERKFNLPIHIDDNCLTSVSKGLAKAVANPKKYKAVLMSN